MMNDTKADLNVLKAEALLRDPDNTAHPSATANVHRSSVNLPGVAPFGLLKTDP